MNAFHQDVTAGAFPDCNEVIGESPALHGPVAATAGWDDGQRGLCANYAPARWAPVLLAESVKHNDLTVLSIYVNATQFNTPKT